MATVRRGLPKRLPKTDLWCGRPACSGSRDGCATKRRGAILVVILVCFVVAAAMFMVLGRQSVAQRRAADTQSWNAQAHWIAEAALERAAARLTIDANYAGETWTISAAELGGKEGAQARIHVAEVFASPDRRLIQVEADYPDDPVHRARWKKQIEFDLKTPTTTKAAKKP